MKKNTIAALLIGTVVTTSLTGCGTKYAATSDAAATSPSYIEAEYPETEYSDAEYPETDYSENGLSSEEAGYAYDAYESPAADSAYATSEEYDSAEEAYAYEEDVYTEAAKAAGILCPGCYDDSCYYEEEPARNYGENYNTVTENPFTAVAANPLSTFGADIDTASYSNLRRMINDGYSLSDITAGSIRTEELVNYFDYDYKKPGNKDAFAVNASIMDCPWNKDTKLVNLGIKAK